MKKNVVTLFLFLLVAFSFCIKDSFAKIEDKDTKIIAFSFNKDKVKSVGSNTVSKVNKILEEAKEELNIIKKIKNKLRFYIILATIGVSILFAWIIGLTFCVVKLWRKA